jgi:hypothetical protein
MPLLRVSGRSSIYLCGYCRTLPAIQVYTQHRKYLYQGEACIAGVERDALNARQNPLAEKANCSIAAMPRSARLVTKLP